jgi:NADH:ubiquinone oxidoreductase subunit
MHVGLHPAWGTSTSITLDCDSQNQNNNAACPAVSSINGTFATTAWTVTLPAPNTRLSVVETTTATTGQQNAWATLFTYAPAANGNDGYINGYIGGSNTDSSGVAVFNVLDTTLRYAVQVNPAWNDTTHAQQTLTNNGAGYTYAQVNNQKFALGSPNLTLTSLAKTGSTVNRGGWVCAEYYNDTLGYSRQWISCVGLNQLGTTKMLLPDTVSSNADKKYVRITFNSGDSSYGATTSCTVVVSNGVVASSGLATTCTLGGSWITQRLSAGNVQGIVKRGDASAVVGAIIKATVHGTTGDAKESSAIMTSTDINGFFGLQLDASKLWDIKIIPVHVSDSPDLASLNVQANNGAATGSGIQPPSGQITLNLGTLTLALKP